MAINLDNVVGWYDARKGALTYSMLGSRNGADGTADCSGSIVQAVYEAGATKYDWLYSTVDLGRYLAANGFTRVSANQDWTAQRGDIILMSWGADMSTSGGAGGHVGVMKDDNTFISTDYWTGGQQGTAVSEHNWNEYYNVEVGNGLQYIEVWRLAADEQAQTNTTESYPENDVTPDTPAILRFKQFNNEFTAYNGIRVDEIKFVNGIWQFINYDLAGGRDFDWTNNGISLERVDNTTRGNEADTQVGDIVKFNSENNEGTIDEYDNKTNAVGIDFHDDGRIWFDANQALAL
ncbi:peptidoglycan hydrolase [Leuconostoc citreum]